MADPENMKEIVNQAAMQAETLVMMIFRDTTTGPWPAITPIFERHKDRNMGD